VCDILQDVQHGLQAADPGSKVACLEVRQPADTRCAHGRCSGRAPRKTWLPLVVLRGPWSHRSVAGSSARAAFMSTLHNHSRPCTYHLRVQILQTGTYIGDTVLESCSRSSTLFCCFSPVPCSLSRRLALTLTSVIISGHHQESLGLYYRR
jgi:hypothetical protein